MVNIEEQLKREMLVESIACGNDDLRNLLDSNFEFVWCKSGVGACSKSEKYLNAQLQLIELGQMFVRNKIDTSKSRGESSSSSESKGGGYSDSQAQRTNQSRTCGFSDSQSFQRSVRDSESTMRSQGDSNEYELEREYEQQADRSTQQSGGYGNTYSYSQSKNVSDNIGYSSSHSESMSESHTRSGLPGSGSDFDIGSVLPGNPFGLSGSFPYFTFDPAPLIGNYRNPGPDRTACEDCGNLSGVNFDTVLEALPNAAASYSVNFKFDISLPIGGGASTIVLDFNFSVSRLSFW